MAEADRLDETLRALLRVLERLAAANEPPEEDPHRRFYETFNGEADGYEKDIRNKHCDDLNTTLIFASLFSAVVGAFIIDIQRELRPDYNEMSFAVLKMLLDATSGIPNQSNVPVPSGPSASAIQVQCILFASLASALLAAFLAMLGKQWLNPHVEGSLVERGHQRELRIRGMTTWRFRIIMDCIPLVIQVSVLLLGYALAQYLWGLSQTVSTVIAAFTGFGVLFYLFTLFASVIWETCPFQTPVSVALRYAISLVKKRQHRLSEVVQQSTTTVTLARPTDEEPAPPPQTPVETFSIPEEAESARVSDTNWVSTIFQSASTSDAVVALARFIPEINWPSNVRNVPLFEIYDCLRKSFEIVTDGIVRPGMRTQAYGLLVSHQQLSTPPIASGIYGQCEEPRADLACILTMFKMTKAPESVKVIMVYITEIVWDHRLKTIPLLQVYQALRESLLCSAEGKVYPRQGARDRAFWSAKALSHLYNQRRCLHHLDTTLPNQLKFINHPSQPLGHDGFNQDFDLQSAFYIVDWTFGVQTAIPWASLQLTEPHQCWLGHVLQYRAFDVLYREQKKLTDDVRGFVAASLSRPQLPARAIADCLFIIRMVAGYEPSPLELLKKDRSHQITEIIDDIFDRLDGVFGQAAPSVVTSSAAVEALELVTNSRGNPRICARSYSLFRIIVDHANDDSEEMWRSARLCLQGASTDMPRVGDPKQLLKFLHHHMRERATIGTQPIHLVFSALVNASGEETKRGLAPYDFTDPLFIDTTIEALENDHSTHLRKLTIFLLPKLDNYLFTTEEAFRDEQKASRFVKAWSSAIHEFLPDPTPTKKVEAAMHPVKKDTHQVEKAVIKILLAIAHLPCLRVHLPKERWALLQHFPYIMVANPPPLQRCLRDPNILPYLNPLLDDGNPSRWLTMLWMMYHDLSQEVRAQLEEETRQIAVGENRYHLSSHLSVLDAHIQNLDGQLSKLNPLDQVVSNLQMKRERTVQTKGRLQSFKSRIPAF